MLKSYRVAVSKKHIQSGIAQNCEKCPIALALQAKFPASHVTMGTTYACVDGVGYVVSRAATRFIAEFDMACEIGRRPKVKPFAFVMKKQ